MECPVKRAYHDGNAPLIGPQAPWRWTFPACAAVPARGDPVCRKAHNACALDHGGIPLPQTPVPTVNLCKRPDSQMPANVPLLRVIPPLPFQMIPPGRMTKCTS